jgi:Sulfotransferase family
LRVADRVRNRTIRLRQYRWRRRAYASREAHIVIGGAPRSGTTLIRKTLDRHPAICCGAETGILLPGGFRTGPVAAAYGIPEADLHALLDASSSQGAFVDAFAARCRLDTGKSRWAEKTPLNVRSFGWVLARFPESRVIHVIRDGRDVVCSMRQHPERRWVDGTWVRELRQAPLELYLRRWVRDVEDGLRSRGDPRYLEVRYEELVVDPAGVLERLLTDLGEAWDAGLLIEDEAAAGSASHHAGTGISARSVERWRNDLTADERRLATSIAGPLLERLGYPSD